jgi:hypothetical protein
MQPVKQKTQAPAAFLGVWGLLRDVVGGCCFRTTIFAGSAMHNRQVVPEKTRLQPPARPNRRLVEIPAAKKRAAAFPLRPFR